MGRFIVFGYLLCALSFSLQANEGDFYRQVTDEYLQLHEKYKGIAQRPENGSFDSKRLSIVYGSESEFDELVSEIQGQSDRPKDFVVLGLSQQTVLRHSGTREDLLDSDEACSELHNQGDWGNRWCHAAFSKLVYSLLKERGQSELLSQSAGLMVFVIKESTDLNYDLSDINTAPIKRKISKRSEASATFMLDSSFHLEYVYKF